MPVRLLLVLSALALGLAGLLTGFDGLDGGQARLCVAILPALEPEGRIRVEAVGVDREAVHGVRVDYVVDPGGAGPPRPGLARCAFAGGLFDAGRLDPLAVETADGRLSGARLLILKRFWIADAEATAEGARRLDTRAVDRPVLPWPVSAGAGYAAQQALNALPGAAVYAMLAAAYALVSGLTGRINLAFGCLAVAGGFAAAGVVTLYDRAFSVAEPAVVLAALAAVGLVAVGQGALAGFVTGHLVHRPLAESGPRAFLIAGVGLALAASEAVRLAAGGGEHWIQPILSSPILVADGGYRVTITGLQALEVAAGAAVLLLLVHRMERGAYGRAWRAGADDPLMASLLGVDAGRTATVAFILSGALAAFAGAMDALHYGHASAAAWLALSLKALMAAVLGGLGSIRGAAVGGALLGLAETAWAAVLPTDNRDIAVMTGLVLLLIFRPDGLFGVKRPLPDSRDARWG